MTYDPSNVHLSSEQLQALLDGVLPRRDSARAETHLAGCSRCSTELDGWRQLFSDLGALPSHRPHEGFAGRVMSSTQLPEERSLAARIRDRIGTGEGHTSSEILQDFLDGDLAARLATHIESHLSACDSCRTEAEAWHALSATLTSLERFTPSDGFAERVMEAVEMPETLPLASRLRARLSTLAGASAPRHVPAGVLQDFVEDLLPARAVARVRAHLDSCATCAHEAASWQVTVGQLDGLQRLAPSADFAARVMEALPATSLAAPAPVRARTGVPARVAGRLLAVANRLVPQTREAWAALSGIAVTPAVVVGLMAYAVFSHPALTLGSLVSFAWWQVADLVGLAASGLSANVLQSSEGFGLFSLFETLAAAPAMVAGGVLVYTMTSALALRVLYRHLISNRPSRGRYAHASTAS